MCRRVLVSYGTGEGQTARIANRVGATVEARGHDVTVANVEESDADVAAVDFDAVFVGASIHAGKHQRAVVDFVRDERETLAGKPTAFFQVSLSSATEQGREQAAGYVESFVEETGWYPDRIGQFGGALRFSEYGFLKRLLIRQVARKEFPAVDATDDVGFTDWEAVDAFATDVAAFVEGRLGETAPEPDA